VAYASLIVYDDRNGKGPSIFHIRHGTTIAARAADVEDRAPRAARHRGNGASFISHDLPDQRVAYREGAFMPGVAFLSAQRLCAARACPGFSILSGGGFFPGPTSPSQRLLAAAQGQLPAEDPTTVRGQADEAGVTIPCKSPDGLTTCFAPWRTPQARPSIANRLPNSPD